MKKLRTYSNLNRKTTWKGILDYKTITIFLIYILVIYNILSILKVSSFYVIYILLLSMIPVMGIYFSINKEENVYELFINITRYLIKPKTYVYVYKNNEKIHRNKIIKALRGKR